MKSHHARKFYFFPRLIILNMLFTVSCNSISSSTQKPSLPVSEHPSMQPIPAPSSTLAKTPTATQTPSPLPSSTMTSLPTATSTMTSLPTATSTPTSSMPTATFIKNANCRLGPGTAYDAAVSFLKGETVQIVGRNHDLNNTWWYVIIPKSTHKCWVSIVTANASGDLNHLPIVKAPALASTPIAPPPVKK